MDKRVAVIIVTFNASKYLGELFSSLQKLNYPRDKFEIVVVDNASTDDTWENLKSQISNLKKNGLQATSYKLQANSGFVGGNNIGLQYAIENNFDYAYMLNQDTVVDSNFLNEVVRVAERDEKISAVQSLLLLYDKKDIINGYGNQIHYLGLAYAGGNGKKVSSFKFQVSGQEITYPSGAGVLLRCETLKRIGLLNPDLFMYHEDVDLGWRMWLAGYKVMLAPQSIVYHKYEFSRSIRKYYFMERNRLIVVFENYKIGTLAIIFPALFIMEVMLFPYTFLVSGFWKEKLKAYIYFFKPDSWKRIFEARKKIQSLRRISDREIMKKFVGVVEFQEKTNPLVKYVFNPIFYIYLKAIRIIVVW